MSSWNRSSVKPEPTYSLVRWTGTEQRTLKRGLSLNEVEEACAKPDARSNTATSSKARKRVAEGVTWFTGYTREE